MFTISEPILTNASKTAERRPATRNSSASFERAPFRSACFADACSIKELLNASILEACLSQTVGMSGSCGSRQLGHGELSGNAGRKPEARAATCSGNVADLTYAKIGPLRLAL